MIRPLTRSDLAEAERLVVAVLGRRQQARFEEVIDVLVLPGFGAWSDDRLVGIATYAVDGSDAEVLALGVAEPQRGRGIAGRLLEAVAAAAGEQGVDRVRVVTTNDNLAALAVYQRHGFRLVELHPGAVERSRALKASIPEIGQNGIPMRDELVLERRLRG